MKILDEIFWSDGNFIDQYGNIIEVQPIGTPRLFTGYYDRSNNTDKKTKIYHEEESIRSCLQDDTKQDKSYNEVNAYMKGEHSTHPNHRDYLITVSFYKI